jgi:ribosomal protein S8
MSQEVLKVMEKKGYIERVKKGPDSYSILTNKERLISDWVEEYSFNVNTIDTYYSANKNILKKFKRVLKENQYALTLHTGANLITSFVKTEDIFIYMNSKDWEKDILDIRQKLDLKELVRGGNIHLIYPFYKNSVFFNVQKIKGFTVVSNLQLYLDLYNFQPRGREQAKHLKSLLEEKGRNLE